MRWSCKSLRLLAEELQERGHVVSHVVVGQLLKTEGFSLQGNAKVIEGNQRPDRNAQFDNPYPELGRASPCGVYDIGARVG